MEEFNIEKSNEDSLEIVIKQLKSEEDLRKLLPIEQASFNEPWRENFFYRMVMPKDKGAIMAITKEADCIGFLTWTLHGPKKKVEITNIAILPAYRQQGIGKLLIEHFVNSAISSKYYETAKLNVGTNNISAKRLYEKYGFVVKREIPNFYKSDSAYCMKSNLSLPIPYSQEQICSAEKNELPKSTSNKPVIKQESTINNVSNNSAQTKNNNNVNMKNNRKANTNKKNQKSMAEPEVLESNHLLIFEEITFRVSTKQKEYS